MNGSRWILAIAISLLAGCSAGTTTAANGGTNQTVTPTDPTVPGVDCHFATTVPGGELPQPQCEIPQVEPTNGGPTPTSVGPWECPEEDYAITIAATSWEPFSDPPEPIPACGGGEIAESFAPEVLIPVSTVAGLPAATSIGLRAFRQPGGIFWTSKVAVPASADPVLTVEAITMTIGFPDQETWRSEQLGRLCGSSSEELTIRNTDGCRQGSVYAWVTDDTAYEMSSRLDLETSEVIAWIETWIPAS